MGNGLSGLFQSISANLRDPNLMKMVGLNISTDINAQVDDAAKSLIQSQILGGVSPLGIVSNFIQSDMKVTQIAQNEIELAEEAGIPGFSSNEIQIGGMNISVHTYLKENGDIGIIREEGVASMLEGDNDFAKIYGDDFKAQQAEIIRQAQQDVVNAGGRESALKQFNGYIKEQAESLEISSANVNGPIQTANVANNGGMSFG